MRIEIPDKYFDEEELKNTPERFKKFMEEWLVKSNEVEFTTFKNPGYDEMLILSPIIFYSFCAHHLIPFFGNAHIGYIPEKNGVICGLSKIPRVINKYSHRPQLQERLTIQIKNYLVKKIKPVWLMVVLEARHLCIEMRGVKKPGTFTFTNAIYPDPRKNSSFNSAKEEFLRMIKTS